MITNIHEALRPKNETKLHFLLKNISIVLLWNMGCRVIGNEVYGMHSESPYQIGTKKSIIDTVGLQYADNKWKGMKVLDNDTDKVSHYLRRYNARGIEAKVSRSDFRNGFSMACEYTYIICPKGMIAKDEVPNKVGIIYVDVDNIIFPITQGNVHMFTEIYKKPRKDYDERFYDIDKDDENTLLFNQSRHDKFIHDTLLLINKENTQRQMFSNIFLHTDWLEENTDE